jgi:zinc/manganese transport system ATP-binding protein
VKDSEALLIDRDSSLGYGGRAVLKSLNGEYHRGERWILVGPNGAGKSTFLQAVFRSGLVVDGQRVCKVPAHRIAFLPQMPRLSWGLPCSIRDFLVSSLAVVKPFWSSIDVADLKCLDLLLEKTGLASVQHRSVGELSGGQAQRVLFARALYLKAEILLLDEPFSAVDTASKNELRALLDECRASTLQLIVLHDPFDVVAAQAPILHLQNGQITRETPEDFRRLQQRNLDVVAPR